MANYAVFISNEFTKELNKINNRDKLLIEKKLIGYIVIQLKKEPHFGINIKKLKNWNPEIWRYRIGNYRIFYQINDETMEVDILTIDHRKDSYR